MPEPDRAALAGVVEEARQEHVGVGHAGRPECGHDVEAVAPVGDRHPVEEGELGRRQPLGQRRSLHGSNPRDDVPAELARLRSPPGG